jgi:hypothetical protein
MAALCQPDWLRILCNSDEWFKPCGSCSLNHSAREAQLNMFDAGTCTPRCSICVGEHGGDSVVQVITAPQAGRGDQ